MTAKHFIKGMILFIPLLLLSCNEEQTITESKCKIICSVDEFESTDLSRTTTDPNNNFLITWASGDVIGIFPREGYQEPFEIPTNQIGNTSASFDGGYWDVKDGLQYNAYYPFDKKNFDSADMKTQIPVSYIGQKQSSTSCNIGAFDYTYSDWKTASGGIVSFDFHHIGAIAVFSLKYPATTTYTKLTLSADDAVIPLEGTYDLTAEDVSFIADENSYSNSISLELNNCSGVAGETGVFYMMLPPMDLSNNEVTFTLTTSEGTVCSYSIEKALNVKKGKLYRRTGIPKESNVEGTIDNWIEESIPYVTFTADATQTLTMSKAVETLEYSVNSGEWKELGTNTVTFGGEYGNLQIRGKSSIGTANSSSDYSNILFGNSTSVACSGDIRTLVNYNKYTTVDTSNAKFCYLFYRCASLTSSPELPAMSLSENCYDSMFSYCKNLTIAPQLPAIQLTEWCYASMFAHCDNLNSAPELPATTLSKNCYRSMFAGCNLSSTPKLPATILADFCYMGMFSHCPLTSAPELPASTLARSCYEEMFSSCYKLTIAPELKAVTLSDSCYMNMFSFCTNLSTAPELPATTLTESCYREMFSRCEKLSQAPKLPATILEKSCYLWMFYGCYSLISAPELPATIMTESCYYGMFDQCYSLSSAPDLPATILAKNCYFWMFNQCKKLKSAPELPATTLAESCYARMFLGCISLESAPELPATTLTVSCYQEMFMNCTNLVTAPILSATSLNYYCYREMFRGCPKLANVTMLAINKLDSYYFALDNWLSGVSLTGVFTKAKEVESLPIGVSGIPEGWTVINHQ